MHKLLTDWQLTQNLFEKVDSARRRHEQNDSRDIQLMMTFVVQQNAAASTKQQSLKLIQQSLPFPQIL